MLDDVELGRLDKERRCLIAVAATAAVAIVIAVAILCATPWVASCGDVFSLRKAAFCGAGAGMLFLAACWCLAAAVANDRRLRYCRAACLYRRHLLREFRFLLDGGLADMTNQIVLAAGQEAAACRTPQTAARADFRLVEMLIEVLSDDPSRRILG